MTTATFHAEPAINGHAVVARWSSNAAPGVPDYLREHEACRLIGGLSETQAMGFAARFNLLMSQCQGELESHAAGADVLATIAKVLAEIRDRLPAAMVPESATAGEAQ